MALPYSCAECSQLATAHYLVVMGDLQLTPGASNSMRPEPGNNVAALRALLGLSALPIRHSRNLEGLTLPVELLDQLCCR